MSVQDHILFSANQNNELLSVLARTDYAASAIEQNSIYMHSLQKEIEGLENNIQDLQVRVAGAKFDYEEYRNSTIRRLAYKIGGRKEKFNKSLEKEEKEYLEALQQDVESRRNLDLLKQNLYQATETNNKLQFIYKEHQDAQVRLDMLYDSIFEGQTPEFPEEDAKEGPKREAQRRFNMLQLQFSAEEQALAILVDSDKCLQRALLHADEALHGIKSDSQDIANDYLDMTDRSPLSRTRSYVAQAEILHGQARCIVPSIPPLPHIEIAPGDVMEDIMAFDSLFMDIVYEMFSSAKSHREVKDLYTQIGNVQKILDGQIMAARQRVASARPEVDSAKAVLEQLRCELQAIRAEAFRKIAGGPLPGYQNHK